MKYTPSLPEHNDNVSHTHPLGEFVLLFSGILIILSCAFWAAGLFVDYAVAYVTPELEAKIFSGFKVPDAEIVDAGDPGQAALQGLVDGLETCVGIGFPLKVYLVDSDQANAVALPGGRILVLSGLLHKVRSENGLAFVLAHELGHFKNRDHLRGMGRGIVITALSALITGAGSDFTQLFAPSVSLNMAQYSQDRERLADQAALKALGCYYGHGGGAAEFFRAMTFEGSRAKSLIGHYFDSHPQALERIEALERLAGEMGLGKGTVKSLPPIFLVK